MKKKTHICPACKANGIEVKLVSGGPDCVGLDEDENGSYSIGLRQWLCPRTQSRYLERIRVRTKREKRERLMVVK